ncbi:hypothetical protein BTURTLESOX_1441 [bacterium endosymbiont of Bathymodiolus sp. 5 South]|nr:hypothetical protein BTURTLESOX_1441 [bacterium endosymbiont of Bathymodiolus sp. 5 South]VVM21431.1 hypothetical protein BSPWISOXPB_2915 [uncultured Gammaproteobacteria bacterium]VVM23384.1 hypothetical protein BSPWISOXPB_7043 [uncultured Gammaproteobacteria bacterium]
MKAVGDFGLSVYPPTAPYYNAAKFGINGVKDYQNGNFDNTKSNIIERIIPKAIERITKVKKEITAPIMEVIKLKNEIKNE